MLTRTHFVITLSFVLLFLPIINNKIIFFSVAIFSTLLPDIDTRFSYLGKRKIFRPLQFFSRHRGFLHSFTFLFLIVVILYFFIPYFVLPFFIGYGMHLFLDCFTPSGIRIFYPLKKKFRGDIITGGKKEFFVFIFFLIMDFLLAGFYLFNMF